MSYRVLNRQLFKFGKYSLVPIRFEDRYLIMKWRNEQIYHLRQNVLLSKHDQDNYFQQVVPQLFEQKQPGQILFSFLENEICIGYGGLVHINWVDQNAEISFIMDTTLERERFQELWLSFLRLIEIVAFHDISLHKIFTHAFDLRPHLYEVLIKFGFFQDARLKDHALFEGKAVDVVIHSRINQKIYLTSANEQDTEITYNWVSDKRVRQFSLSKEEISFEDHRVWFKNKIHDPNCFYYILHRGAEKVGSVRIDYNKDSNTGIISYLVGSNFHGMGYGKLVLELVEELILVQFEVINLIGLVMKANEASVRIFYKLGYDLIVDENDILTFSKIIKH